MSPDLNVSEITPALSNEVEAAVCDIIEHAPTTEIMGVEPGLLTNIISSTISELTSQFGLDVYKSHAVSNITLMQQKVAMKIKFLNEKTLELETRERVINESQQAINLLNTQNLNDQKSIIDSQNAIALRESQLIKQENSPLFMENIKCKQHFMESYNILANLIDGIASNLLDRRIKINSSKVCQCIKQISGKLSFLYFIEYQ